MESHLKVPSPEEYRNSPKRKVPEASFSLALLRRLPKAELHCHMGKGLLSLVTLSDGSARISTIIELAKEQGVELPSYEEEELKKLVTVGNDCPSLLVYLQGFG